MRRATLKSRAASATDEPPHFWATSPPIIEEWATSETEISGYDRECLESKIRVFLGVPRGDRHVRWAAARPVCSPRPAVRGRGGHARPGPETVPVETDDAIDRLDAGSDAAVTQVFSRPRPSLI